MAEIRSEMLWHFGAEEACSFITNMLTELGLDIEVVKPSSYRRSIRKNVQKELLN